MIIDLNSDGSLIEKDLKYLAKSILYIDRIICNKSSKSLGLLKKLKPWASQKHIKTQQKDYLEKN
jgi:hypothetical protein